MLDPSMVGGQRGEHLTVHDRVGLTLVGSPTLRGDIGRERLGPVSQRNGANRTNLIAQADQRRSGQLFR